MLCLTILGQISSFAMFASFLLIVNVTNVTNWVLDTSLISFETYFLSHLGYILYDAILDVACHWFVAFPLNVFVKHFIHHIDLIFQKLPCHDTSFISILIKKTLKYSVRNQTLKYTIILKISIIQNIALLRVESILDTNFFLFLRFLLQIFHSA